MQRIVVWDPAGELAEATVFMGPKATATLHARGLVSLPVDPDIVGQHALGGYFRRAWGEGWTFDKMVGTRGCPMMLLMVPDRQFIHWCARIVPIRPGERPQGTIRLTTSTGQVGALGGGLAAETSVVELRGIGDPDELGGWTIRGRSRASLIQEGLLALNLYGSATNVKVLWSAIALSRNAE